MYRPTITRMNDVKKRPPEQSFCIYCQEEHGTMSDLVEHIEAEHQNTYAYWNIAVPHREAGG